MISIFLSIFLLTILWVVWLRQCRKLPPGPKSLPLLGSLPFITTKNGVLDFFLDEEVTKYKLTTVGFGPFMRLFVINDYDFAKVMK